MPKVLTAGLVPLDAGPSTSFARLAPNLRQFKRGSCGFRRLTAVSRRRAPVATDRRNPAQRCGKRLRKAKNPRTPARRDFPDVRISRPLRRSAASSGLQRFQEVWFARSWLALIVDITVQ